MPNKSYSGFTLIELMIAMAIIGIIASIAIPTYNVYVVRAQISEAYSLASALKTEVSEIAAQNGSFDNISNGTQGMPSANSTLGKYVSSGTVSNGSITIQFRNSSDGVSTAIANQSLVFSPTITNTVINWQCTSTIAQRYLTSSCVGS